VLALLIAVPMSTAVAFVITRYFLNFFNIDYNQFQVSSSALVYQVLIALAAPLLAGLPAVLQGSRITVRDAIASYGLGGGLGSNWLDRLVENIGLHWLPSQYATALGNMFRHKGRLLMTGLVLVTAGAAFLMVMSLNSSIGLTLDNIFARSQFDTVIQFGDNERLEHVQSLAESVPGIDKAELHLVQPASMFVAGQLVKEAGIGTRIEGIPAGSDFFEPLMVAGRWLRPGDGRSVVIPRDTAQKNNIKVGDTVTLDLGQLGKDNWQVAGLYDPVFAGIVSGDKIYAPADALYQATKKYNQGTRLLLRTSSHGEQYTADLTARLKELFDQRGMKVDDTQTQTALRKTNSFQFGIETDMMLALSVIVAVVGGIALTGSLSIGVIERTKEIGVLRAVGARSKTILGIFIMEGILQGFLSWLVAIPVALLASPLLAEALGKTLFGAKLDYQFNWMAVALWLVMVMMIAAVASIMPANSASRISVRDSLAYA
jgi:putative ABC transport system permease protein